MGNGASVDGGDEGARITASGMSFGGLHACKMIRLSPQLEWTSSVGVYTRVNDSVG